MTEKKKQLPKTNMEKMGFADLDLYNKLHDRICLWVRKQENILKIIKESFGEYQYEDLIIEKIINKWDEKYKNKGLEYLNKKEKTLKYKIVEVIPEYPIEKNNNIIGFIDLKINIQFYILVPVIKYIFDEQKIQTLIDKRILCEDLKEIKNKIDNYVFHNPNSLFKDLNFKIIQNHRLFSKTILFEVKSSISSIGALEREINYYRSYITKSDKIHNEEETTEPWFFVISPKIDEYLDIKKILLQSSIFYFECPLELISELELIKEQKYLTLEERIKKIEDQLNKKQIQQKLF